MANVFTEAKKYQKLHPRTSWQDCIKKVSGKKRTVGSAKKAAPKKKAAPTAKKVVVRKAGVVRISGTVGSALSEFQRVATKEAAEAARLEQMKCVGMAGKSAAEKSLHKRAIEKQRNYVSDLKQNKNRLKKYI